MKKGILTTTFPEIPETLPALKNSRSFQEFLKTAQKEDLIRLIYHLASDPQLDCTHMILDWSLDALPDALERYNGKQAQELWTRIREVLDPLEEGGLLDEKTEQEADQMISCLEVMAAEHRISPDLQTEIIRALTDYAYAGIAQYEEVLWEIINGFILDDSHRMVMYATALEHNDVAFVSDLLACLAYERGPQDLASLTCSVLRHVPDERRPELTRQLLRTVELPDAYRMVLDEKLARLFGEVPSSSMPAASSSYPSDQ